MRVIVLCMRKLVMICYGVLKDCTLFDPEWGAKMST